MSHPSAAFRSVRVLAFHASWVANEDAARDSVGFARMWVSKARRGIVAGTGLVVEGFWKPVRWHRAGKQTEFVDAEGGICVRDEAHGMSTGELVAVTPWDGDGQEQGLLRPRRGGWALPTPAACLG